MSCMMAITAHGTSTDPVPKIGRISTMTISKASKAVYEIFSSHKPVYAIMKVSKLNTIWATRKPIPAFPS
ncbi:hypothetical protein D3C84_1102180 [compost metagenome]